MRFCCMPSRDAKRRAGKERDNLRRKYVDHDSSLPPAAPQREAERRQDAGRWPQ